MGKCLKILLFFSPPLIFTWIAAHSILTNHIGVEYALSRIVFSDLLIYYCPFLLSGLLLTLGKPWGCVFGLLIGGDLINRGRFSTLPYELMIGILFVGLYLCCGVVVYKDKRGKK